jgi:hypothetical protein
MRLVHLLLASKPEIAQLIHPILHEYILGLDVAVGDVILLQEGHRLCHLVDDHEGVLFGYLFGFLHQTVQGALIAKLQHNVDVVGGFQAIEDLVDEGT